MLVGVANSSMNPDPEPVNGGPIQVFIMAGQPACVEVPCLYGDTSHQPSFLGLTLTACSRLAALTCSGRAARRAQWAHTKHVADFEPNNTQASPTWRDTASWQGKKSGRLGSNHAMYWCARVTPESPPLRASSRRAWRAAITVRHSHIWGEISKILRCTVC